MRCDAHPRALDQLQEVGVGVLRDHHEVGRSATSRSRSAFGSGGPRAARARPRSTCPGVVGPARHRDEALRRQDLHQHLVGREVEGGDALRLRRLGPRGVAAARRAQAATSSEPPSRHASSRARRDCLSAAPRAAGRRTRSRRAPRPRRAHRDRARGTSGRPRRRCGTRRSRRRGRRSRAARRAARRRTRGRRSARRATRGSTQVRTARRPDGDHLLGQRARRPAPEREERPQAGARQALLAVAADVLEEEVAEGHRGDARARARRPWRRAIAAS